MARGTCTEEYDGAPCGRPKSKHSNKRCAWHRLLTMPASFRDQNSVSRANREQPAGSWRKDDKLCNVCGWYVPRFFMGRGRRCVGCEGKARHESHVTNNYNLLEGDYDALFSLQLGRCAICRKRQVKFRLATDHDHPSDVVRGLLCSWCNEQILGSAGGDTEKALPVLRAAVYYLEHHPTSGRWQPPELQPEFGFPRPASGPTHDPVLGDPDPVAMSLAPF